MPIRRRVLGLLGEPLSHLRGDLVMFRRILPVVALVCVLVLPQVSLAQYDSFPGDWPQPGRGPGFGRSGFQRAPTTLPFPYDGINGSFGGQRMFQSTMPVFSTSTQAYPSYYPALDTARAFIRVRVPAEAKVFFDGSPTVQSGTERLFMSPALENGPAYSYEVSARWMADGKERTVNRTVRVTPGQTVQVDLMR
jgi:uncharacterized protein (TIGR03000 family)